MHITERVGGRTGHGTFAGESCASTGSISWVKLFPGRPWPWWGPGGRWIGVRGRRRRYNGQAFDSLGTNQVAGDRLLSCWAIAPLVLVSLASARNAHYAIYALVPWSIWAALGLARLGSWQITRGWSPVRLRRLTWGMFAGLAAAYGLSFWLAGPWFDRRALSGPSTRPQAARCRPRRHSSCFTTTGTATRIPLLSDPFPTTWRSASTISTGRPAGISMPGAGRSWEGEVSLHNLHDSPGSMMIIGRDRDLPALSELGQVEVLSRSCADRWDRPICWPESSLAR